MLGMVEEANAGALEAGLTVVEGWALSVACLECERGTR